MTTIPSSNNLASSFFNKLPTERPITAETCFKHFMGKEFAFSAKGTADNAVYTLFSQAINPKIGPKGINAKVDHLPPKQLQALLAIAHDLALRNNQPEKASALKKQWENTQGGKSSLTTLKVIGFILALAGVVGTYKFLIKNPQENTNPLLDPNVPQNLSLLNSSGIEGILPEQPNPAISKTSFSQEQTIKIEEIGNENMHALQKLGEQNKEKPIDGKQSRKKYEKIILKEAVKGNTSLAIKGDKYAMQKLEQLYTKFPIKGMEKIRKDFDAARAQLERDNASRLKLIEVYEPYARKGLEFSMGELEKLQSETPINGIEAIRKDYKAARLETIEHSATYAKNGGIHHMSTLEKLHSETPIDGIEDIREDIRRDYEAARAKSIETHTTHAKNGRKYSMEELEEMHSETPIAGIEGIRKEYEAAVAKKAIL